MACLVAMLAAAGALAILPSGAHAADVIMLGPGHRTSTVDDRFLTAVATTPAPDVFASTATRRRPRRHKAPCTVCAVLTRLRRAGAITDTAYLQYRQVYAAATGALRRLLGTRAAELGAVIGNLQQMAAAGLLRAPRLPALFQTLDRNREWWTRGPLLGQYQRVEFSGSQLVWEYYPGQGIELQVLASFGKADGLYTAGRAEYPAMRVLLDELIPLAVPRAGGLAWEYYFQFDGGRPPWISGMAQGTAIEALTRAYRAFGDPSYLHTAHLALGPLEIKPPAGVAIPTPVGTRFLQYSFAPSTPILNAFLQTLIGLYDYAHASGDPRASALFAAGDSEARSEVPGYDTGAWSLYQPGVEDSLSYHLLVTGFLQGMCARTGAAVYCRTAQHFETDLKTPPALVLLTQRLRRRTPGVVRFRLSKYSHVGIVVVRAGHTLLATSAYFAYGVGAFAILPLSPGRYTVRLAATDLAGNFSRLTGTLSVPAAPHHRRRGTLAAVSLSRRGASSILWSAPKASSSRRWGTSSRMISSASGMLLAGR